MHKGLTLRSKILLVSLCAVLGGMLIQTLLFQRVSTRLFYEQEQKESYHSLENMSRELETLFRAVESDIISIYNDKECMKDLGGTYDLENMRLKYRHRARDLALDNFAASDGVLALYLYNNEHDIISTYRKSMTPKRNYPKDIYEDMDRYNSEIVRKYIESDENRMLISGYNSTTSTQSIIRFVVKIHNMNHLNQAIGYVVCDIDSKAVYKIMEKYRVSTDTYIWVQCPGDQVIATLDNPDHANREYYENLCDLIQRGEKMPQQLQGDSSILFQVGQERYGAYVYEILPQSLLLQSQIMLTRTLVIIAIIIALIMVLFTVYLTKILTKPLEQLTETVTAIGQGNTEMRAKVGGQDEINQLSIEFNHMLDEIQELIGKEYESKILLDQAQYKALQAQINPHFLYNTLDTMSSIAEIQDCEIVSQMCQSLSSIFRYSLDMKHPYSTIAKEVNHLKNYIFVMNVRMRGEIEYNFDIDEEVLTDTIPRISIQPLVENAINHGLKNKHGKKRIEVKATVTNDMLELAVTDNGVGMDASEVNEKLKANDIEIVEAGNSIGIYNINARMKMLYGNEYGMHVESEIGEGTTVTMIIPRKTLVEVE